MLLHLFNWIIWKKQSGIRYIKEDYFGYRWRHDNSCWDFGTKWTSDCDDASRRSCHSQVSLNGTCFHSRSSCWVTMPASNTCFTLDHNPPGFQHFHYLRWMNKKATLWIKCSLKPIVIEFLDSVFILIKKIKI